jgi:hypothetical protein
MTYFSLAFVLGAILHPNVPVTDIDGISRQPLNVTGKAGVVFFVTNDCPVSNYYSHEMRRICDEYGSKGVACSLVYIDPTLSDADARKHAAEYGHGAYPKIVDRKHDLVKATGATITPEAVVLAPGGKIEYRGRIDNAYAGLGKPRRVVTEHEVRDALDAVITGRPVPKPETGAVGCYIPDLSVYSRH